MPQQSRASKKKNINSNVYSMMMLLLLLITLAIVLNGGYTQCGQRKTELNGKFSYKENEFGDDIVTSSIPNAFSSFDSLTNRRLEVQNAKIWMAISNKQDS